MIHLPIVERELRLAARRPGTQWNRVIAAASTIVLAMWSSTEAGFGSRTWVHLAGRPTFITLALAATLASVATALRLTSPCIASEKREGTLGLLFLTDLKPYDVVFGKLAATMLNTFYQALAAVPVFAIPILMGGVTLGDVVLLAAVLMNMVFLAAAVGLFASTLSRNEKEAAGLAWVLFLGTLCATPLAAAFVGWWGGPRAPWLPLLVLSPASALFYVIGQGGMPVWWVCVPLATGQLCAWGCLALTCRIIPRVWQDRPSTASQQTRNERFRDVVQGDSAARTERRRRMLALNPIYWLNNRDRIVPWYPWFFLAAMVGLAVWVTVGLNARWTEHSLVLGTCWLFHLVFKTWVSSQSAGVFSADRDRGALELLLSTPLTTQELLRGHWLGLARLFAAPIGLFLVFEVFWVSQTLAHGTDGTNRTKFVWVLAYIANIAVFFVDLWALSWVALWLGARGKNGSQGASKAQFRLLTLPWILVAPTVPLLDYLFDLRDTLAWTVGLWVASSLPLAITSGRRARSALYDSLREVAHQRATGESPGPPQWITRVARGLARAVAGRA